MALDVGSRLGPYEIVAALGAGGMGEVYKARDTRLDRTVAVKILAQTVADDPERRARFQREARTVSTLNHPHICALYDVGDQDGVEFLVMEYLEGETLASRLQRGALPVAEALKVAGLIADAIHTAHRQGVVHRDLKPANVMLTTSGPKLLDFGLARQAQPIGMASESMVPTGPSPLTAKGTILGTMHYMAPEQLEGKEADPRTDIFAFGAVLHEMLTGKKAFDGNSQVSVIAAIVDRDPPPVSSLAPLSPPLVDHLVRMCLAKNPDNRWQDMADVLIQLRLIEGLPTERRMTPPSRRRSWIAWAAAATLLAAAAVAVGMVFFRGTAERTTVVFEVPLADERSGNQFAISPTGTVATLAASASSQRAIWIRTLEKVTPTEIPKTDGANFPFWSPDGESIGFFADGKLMRVNLTEAPPQNICDAPNGRGGTWNKDGVIVFAPGLDGPLFRVSAAPGSAASPLTKLDDARQEIAHRHPFFLPDGRHFLFLAVSKKAGNSGIYVGSLDSQNPAFLVTSEVKAEFAGPDQLFVMRGNTLVAYRFDSRRLRLDGEPSVVAQSIGHNTNNGAAAFSVSANGALVVRTAADAKADDPFRGRFEWYDRSGNELETAWAGVKNAVIAPDQRHLAAVMNQGDAASDIWVLDLERKTPSRFTVDEATDDLPVWSPQGDRIVFRSNRKGVFDLYERGIDQPIGSERPLLTTDRPKTPLDWVADTILYMETDPQTGADLWMLPMTGDRKPVPVVRSPFHDIWGRFSPDGRYIAYVSNESKAMLQLYVQDRITGKRWPISTDARQPRWRHDGKELYFLSGVAPRPIVMAVDLTVSPDASLRPGIPRKLFALSNPIYVQDERPWDVGADGQRFLFHVPTERPGSLTVILNWVKGAPVTPRSGG